MRRRIFVRGYPELASLAPEAILQPVTHYWRVCTRLPDRFGEPCRVLTRGRRNSILVEFSDGTQVVTSRNYVRRLPYADA